MNPQIQPLSSSTDVESNQSSIAQLINLLLRLPDFTLFWIGQSLSQIGTRLTGFGLGIWVYQNTHAVTELSWVIFATTLPGVLLTPVIGRMVDRWNRRWVIFGSDLGAALITLVLLTLLMQDNLQVWHTYISAFFTSVCGSFQMIAKGAALPMLVPSKQLGRANGLIQLSNAISQISAPALAGIFLALMQLQGLLWIDLASYMIGLITLLFIQIPEPPLKLSDRDQKSFSREIWEGWKVISSELVLTILLLFMTLHFLVDGTTSVLFNPLILSFSTTQSFGLIMSLGGAGMVIGSLIMSIWGGGDRLLSTLFGLSAVNGIGLFIAGIKPSIPIIASGIFLSFLTLPIIMGINWVIWQTNVKPHIQGRVFSLFSTLTGLALAFGNLGSSPLTDHFLEPMLDQEGILANTLGRLIGTGQGRGIGFLISLEGLVLLLVSIGLYNYFRWRQFDESLLLANQEE